MRPGPLKSHEKGLSKDCSKRALGKLGCSLFPANVGSSGEDVPRRLGSWLGLERQSLDTLPSLLEDITESSLPSPTQHGPPPIPTPNTSNTRHHPVTHTTLHSTPLPPHSTPTTKSTHPPTYHHPIPPSTPQFVPTQYRQILPNTVHRYSLFSTTQLTHHSVPTPT